MRWAISALIAAIVGAMFLLPGVAQAHTITLSPKVSCLEEDGSWSVVWTATNSEAGLDMNIEGTTMWVNDAIVADPSFAPNPVPPLGDATATSDFGPSATFVDLEIEATWVDGEVVLDDADKIRVLAPTDYCLVEVCVDGEIIEVPANQEQEPQDTGDCDVITICSNGEFVTGTEFELAQLPRTDDCGEQCEFDPSLSADDPNCVPPEDPCAFDPNLEADDPDCAPPPAIAQGCVDTDGDGQGDEYQVYPEGNPPAGAILTADGDACTPVSLPQPPLVQEVQAVTTISEVLPVALPASGQGFASDNGIAQSTWIVALTAALVATGSLSLLTARRRTADVVAQVAPPAPITRATAQTESGGGWLLAVGAGIIGLAALRTRGRNKRR